MIGQPVSGRGWVSQSVCYHAVYGVVFPVSLLVIINRSFTDLVVLNVKLFIFYN